MGPILKSKILFSFMKKTLAIYSLFPNGHIPNQWSLQYANKWAEWPINCLRLSNPLRLRTNPWIYI